jgi:hypothetical protein
MYVCTLYFSFRMGRMKIEEPPALEVEEHKQHYGSCEGVSRYQKNGRALTVSK